METKVKHFLQNPPLPPTLNVARTSGRIEQLDTLACDAGNIELGGTRGGEKIPRVHLKILGTGASSDTRARITSRLTPTCARRQLVEEQNRKKSFTFVSIYGPPRVVFPPTKRA